MPVDIGQLKLYMGPTTLGAPDNLQETVISFIDEAHEDLFIAVQALESRAIAGAILAAKERGGRVRLILEGNYLTVDTPANDPWSPGGEIEANRLRLFGLACPSIFRGAVYSIAVYCGFCVSNKREGRNKLQSSHLGG